MQAGIVIALPTEWGYFRKAFHLHHERSLSGNRHYTGRYGRFPVAVVLSGVGRENAARAAHLLCEAHPLSVLISLGFAGALSPELKRGDIVLSHYSKNEDSPEPSPLDKEVSEELKGVADESHEHHVYVAPLHTANRIIARHEEKKQLFEKHQCQIVDMESLSIYLESRKRNIPFVGIHAITDTAEEDIPALEIINPFLTSKSNWRYLKIFMDIARRPKSIWDLALLNHDAKVAGNNLSHFLIANRPNIGGLLARLSKES